MAINAVVAFVELLLDPEASKRIRRALSTLILASLSWKINIYPATFVVIFCFPADRLRPSSKFSGDEHDEVQVDVLSNL